jgi:hypothetical protein
MVRNQTVGRLVDGINDNSTVVYDIMRDANERMFKFNRTIVDEAQRTQEERSDLVRQFLQSPTDISGLNSALFETWTKRTRRRVELMRTFFDDLRDMGAETRSAWERVTDASRETTRAAANAGRELASVGAREAAERVEEVSDAAEKASRRLQREARERESRRN